MHISRLALNDFRSWKQLVLDFSPNTNVLLGRNGLGKTNIVEAVEVLSTGASHRVSSLSPVVARGCTSATIRANVEQDSTTTTYEATITLRGANRGRINSGASVYLRDIIGEVPSISFTPEDQRLVLGDPAARRTLLNQAGVLLEPQYPQVLQQFTHIAKQRSSLLKQLGSQPDQSTANAALAGLEVWTGQFIETGLTLTKLRQQVIDRLSEPFRKTYCALAGSSEQAELAYKPSFEEAMLYASPEPYISEHFQRIYPGEIARGVNLIGPQRDDLELLLNGMAAREFASNGETWTMALAIKLALFDVVKQQYDVAPIVILDDVFSQLDDSRRHQILEFAEAQGQVLITAASNSDVPSGLDANLIDVAQLAGEQ